MKPKNEPQTKLMLFDLIIKNKITDYTIEHGTNIIPGGIRIDGKKGWISQYTGDIIIEITLKHK